MKKIKLLPLLVLISVFSCNKKDQPDSKTSLLVNKKWDLKEVTAAYMTDGTPVWISPDTVDYSMDNYYFYTSDGRYQFLDNELKTPGFTSDTLARGQWKWQQDGSNLWMMSDDGFREEWHMKIIELTATDLRYEYIPDQTIVMYYHYVAIP